MDVCYMRLRPPMASCPTTCAFRQLFPIDPSTDAMLTVRAFVACVILTVIASGIALRIEYLNARLGGYLPRHQGKWRFAARLAQRHSHERRVLHERLEQFLETHERSPTAHEAEDLLAAPLTPQEAALIELRLEEERSTEELRARLHLWLSTAGLLQYPLSLACSVWGLCFLMNKSPGGIGVRISGAVIVVVAGTCLLLAFTREYFGSLGW